MPATKNAMTRYALIDKMLANRNRSYSIQDITDMLAEKLAEFGLDPVSKRCVEKDIHYLEYDSPFDVDIEEYWVDAADCNDRPYRKRCIRYTDPTFSIFKPKLSEDEKTILSATLDTLGNFEGLDNFEWLNDLQNRLDLEPHPAIISFSKNLKSNSTLIAGLFTKIKLKCVITLHYHTFGDASIRTVDVTPHILKEYNNRWFLIASACDSGKILTFPLDRIDSFNDSFVSPYIPMPDDLFERFEDMVGMSYKEDAIVEKIVFWVSDKSKDYVHTKPIHESQRCLRNENALAMMKEFPSLSGGELFQINCIENYELIRELCSFGPDLVVLSPAHLRNKIHDRLRQMIEHYN